MKKYHTINSFRGFFSIILEWVIIIGVAALCEVYFHWTLYLLAVIIIGARLLALGLIMHEAVHGLLSKNKGLNDWLAELFCAWPLFISMRSYKVKHLAHHVWLNTDRDPDFKAKTKPSWQYPMTFSKFMKQVVIQLSGFGIFESFTVMSSAQMKEKKAKTPFWYHALRLLFYASIITAFVVAGKGMLLVWYWVIPFATWTQLINRWRRVAEHSAVDNKAPSMQTRTTIHGALSRFLLSPKNISYHNEHHLYPGIPCYHLPKVHKELQKHAAIRSSLHVSNTYSDVYKECIIGST